MSCAMSSFLCSQPFRIYAFSSCRCASLDVTSCISHIDVHTGKSTAVSVTLMSMLRPHISLSLFSSWLCHDSQSAVNSLGPGLYSMNTLCWYMFRIVCCRDIATSLPNIATNGLRSTMTCLHMQNSSGGTSPAHAGSQVLLSLCCCTVP